MEMEGMKIETMKIGTMRGFPLSYGEKHQTG